MTQKEIARQLNISRSLVTRALKGYPDVADSTRRRIQALASEMGYTAEDNREARVLNARRLGRRFTNGTIAITFPPVGQSPRSLPFFVPLLDGIETEAEAMGIDTCLCPLRPHVLPRLVRERAIDGVLMLSTSHWHIASIRELGLPVVNFHRSQAGQHNVLPDDRDGAQQATRLLLESGHRRIAFLGVEDAPGQAGTLRLEGYLRMMRDYGIEVPPSWIVKGGAPTPSPRSYCEGCDECIACTGWGKLVAQNGGASKKPFPFTALVCHNDPVAMGAIFHAGQDGVRVPHDLSVTGFDDVSLDFNFQPALTSLSFPRYEMGRCSVRLLQAAIEDGAAESIGKARDVPQKCVFPVGLVVRQSTRPIPVEGSSIGKRTGRKSSSTKKERILV